MFRRGAIIDEALHQCLDLGLDPVIKRMPKGYDTLIGDGASDSLPGGIRQRVAIARALVTKPKVILFDEANTSLDMEGDEILKKALIKLQENTTVLLVSHRPSLVKISDYGYKINDNSLQPATVDSLTSFPPRPNASSLEVVSAR
jgi:ATP-binding cassette subfamily C protein LapB